MALFTNPVVLSDDGGSTTDRSFSFLNQDVSSPNSVTGIWLEDAADQTAESRMIIKHDQRTLKSGFRRDLLQRTVKLHPAADTETDDLQPVTVNLTVTADSRFTATELQGEVNLIIDALEESGFLSGFRSGKI
jgi:hypothetical protein